MMKCLMPGKLGTMTLKNRVIFPSMCNFYGDDEGNITPRLEAYVRARAEGGAAAIIMPASPFGKPGPARPALSDDRYEAGWKRLLAICHENDCRLIAQIHPAKAQAGRDPALLMPDAMPQKMIEEIISGYAACAKRARAFGVDGVEIHGAHAHEVAQFLSPYYNHRTDEYGGSPEKRARLACEVIRAIKREAGADYPVIFRISAREMIPGGRELEESMRIAPLLEAAGADALHVSIGMPLSEGYISAPMDVPDGFNVEAAAKMRACVSIPVIAVDRINTPELAEQTIAQEKADFVAIGRGMLADPQFVNKIGTEKPIRFCLGCNQGCRKSVTKKAIYCVQNPFTGREQEWTIKPLPQRPRVLVVGAGVSGLEAALDFALRGAQVEAWEAQTHAGGLIELAKLPPHKAVLERLIAYRLAMLEQLGVPVRNGRRADVESIAAFAPRLVILATGSKPAMPPIDGLRDSHVMAVDDVLPKLDVIEAKRCAVLGGGLAGLETADALCARGIQAEVFEMADTVGTGLPVTRKGFVMDRLNAGGCVIHTGARIQHVAFPMIGYEQDGQTMEAGPYDLVITALGRRSERVLADELREKHPEIECVCVGDADHPATALEATAGAAELAVHWEGK